ncbi:MAG: acetylornithine transaminase [Deltaproteobacteria bacterium]|nr:MAG: acetylornithine transaminase [Deltaproteobacteria bacterium]
MTDWVEEERRYVLQTYDRYPVVLVRGKGCRVWDVEGREYLDFVGGIAVLSLGHSHPRVVAAIKEQAERLLHVSNLYYTLPQVELARRICENSFGEKVFFCNSGAEANEAAIKLARKYAKLHLGPERYEIITMENSFHGRTLATLTATAQEKFHKGFEPLVHGFRYCPFNDLEAVARAIGPRTCAVMVEPIQGEGGVNVPSEDYLRGLRELCDEKGVLLIYDEVQTGMGRTGRLFAYEHYGAPPDIMTLAKALGGGIPIGAMVTTDKVAQGFSAGDHASTFGGNPLAARAACAVFDVLLGEGVLENCQRMGEYLMEGLEALKDKYPSVVDVRGKGLLVGMELRGRAKEVALSCLKRGVLINNIGDRVLRFAPPLIVGKEEIDRLCEVLEEVLSQIKGG